MKRKAIGRIAGLVLTLALVAAACSGSGDGAVELLGDPIPATAFETFAGESTSLAAYDGQPLVVNSWASWCPSCVAEMSAAFVPAQIALGDDVGAVRDVDLDCHLSGSILKRSWD